MLPNIPLDPDELFRGTRGLPPLPEVVFKIHKMMSTDEIDLEKISDILTSDVSLVTQILRIVNSAYYGIAREITNLRFSIAYLGINEVYRIALSLSVVSSFELKDRSILREFWRHSFYAALCTRQLAKKYARLEQIDDFWSASLLHDVGKLVYLRSYPDHYTTLKQFALENQCYFSEAEQHYGVTSSAALGQLLCDFWQLPSTIKEACQYHTLKDLKSLEPDHPNVDFHRIICLGNLFSQLSTDELSDKKKRETSAVIMEKTGTSEAEFLADVTDTQALQFKVDEFMKNM